MNYSVLTADIPWSWDDSLPGDRGAEDNLRVTLTLEQACGVRLPPLEPDAVCFLWRPASRLADALAVMQAWGFAPKTEVVWVKQTSKGNRAFGMGHIVRGEHETCLIGVRGRPSVHSRSVRSTFTAPMNPYSKPHEFYSLVHELYPEGTWYDRTSKAWGQGWKKYTYTALAVAK